MPGPAWLILPTYDEAENIERIVAAALEVLERAAPGGHRDPRRRRRLARRHRRDRRPRWPPSTRPSRCCTAAGAKGSAAAYLAGFDRALAGGAGYVLEMDADFSHDPRDLARLLAAVRDGRRPGARLALRRRRRGSPTGAGCGALVSRGGSLYARRVLGLGVRDLTGGFKCFRAEVLRAIDLPTVRSHGYAFQVELTYRALQGRVPRRRGADHLPRPRARRARRCRGGSRPRPSGWSRPAPRAGSRADQGGPPGRR